MSVLNRRSHSLRTLTCRHCSKQFQANRNFEFCSATCRYTQQHTISPAQEGATTHDHTNPNNH